MSTRFYSALGRFEQSTIAPMVAADPCVSLVLFSRLLKGINERLATGKVDRDLPWRCRAAMSLDPYSPQMAAVMALHNKVVEVIAQTAMQGLLTTVQACNARRLPVPVIVSCEKYLDKARTLFGPLRERYFGIDPIIVRGDLALDEPRFRDHVLTLPCADSYEALPVKIFELLSFFQAVGATHGLLKIDDDSHIVPLPTFSEPHLTGVFASADYLGTPVQTATVCRLWHAGKCSGQTAVIYGKPVRTTWGRGGLYYVSTAAMQKIAMHYFRFPGCLDGEIYEDKAVGDVLYENGILLMPCMLERDLGIDSITGQDARLAEYKLDLIGSGVKI